jgi:NADP-dependent 3-hydroxy acid dehydrogenase YdfG
MTGPAPSSPAPAKVALVTGASSGIGKAIVLQLLKDGWRVYGAARRMEKMADLAAAGTNVLPLDVTDAASVTAAVQALLAAEGRIDDISAPAAAGLGLGTVNCHSDSVIFNRQPPSNSITTIAKSL